VTATATAICALVVQIGKNPRKPLKSRENRVILVNTKIPISLQRAHAAQLRDIGRRGLDPTAMCSISGALERRRRAVRALGGYD
jgi:hypothetical protein